jgi:hypothetical protein
MDFDIEYEWVQCRDWVSDKICGKELINQRLTIRDDTGEVIHTENFHPSARIKTDWLKTVSKQPQKQ